jgi:2'-5' RNA ligase
VRQFLVAELPPELHAAVVGVGLGLRPALGGWRWVEAGGVHLTLRFLGQVDEPLDSRARPVWRAVARASPPFRLGLTEPGCFPERGAPRVLWVGVRETEPGGSLHDLALRLERSARELVWAAEQRPFRPHLTLARRRRDARRAERVRSTSRATVEGWVRRVLLMHSRLGSGAARYTALESFPLGGELQGVWHGESDDARSGA